MRAKNRGETFVLKHRLTGAAVLIGFAVIVLPMLLGGPENGGNRRNDEPVRSASSNQVFQSSIKPIGGEVPRDRPRPGDPAEDPAGPDSPSSGEDAGGQWKVTAAPDDQPDGPAAGGAEGGEGTGAAQQTASAAVQETRGEEPGGVERGWIVQVGTFRNPDNVNKLVDKLENGGFESSTTEVETAEGMATRVWVGPFATRVEAARTKTRVKQRTGSEWLIVAYP